MNSEVDPQIDRSLIDYAKGALGPTPAQRANLRARIDGAIATGALIAASAPASTGVGKTIAWGWVTVSALGSVAVIGVLVVALRWVPSSEPAHDADGPTLVALPPNAGPTGATASASESGVASAAVEMASAAVERVAPEPPHGTEQVPPHEPADVPAALNTTNDTRGRHRSAIRPAGHARAADEAVAGAAPTVPADPAGDLLAETLLMRQVHIALRAEQPDRALTLLRRHEREFPAGVLAEEREANTVLALCAGRQPEASRRLGERFLRDHPASVHAARVARTCTE